LIPSPHLIYLREDFFMLRISAAIAVLVLTGTIAIGVSAAQAQSPSSTKGGFSMEKCVAACKQGGGRWCDKFCEGKAANRR
jgi:hypothetical protein